jgi:hypothetical protein
MRVAVAVALAKPPASISDEIDGRGPGSYLSAWNTIETSAASVVS